MFRFKKIIMKKLKLLLTFDHELPLGETTVSYANALFHPTEKVFDLAGQLEVPVNIFTDILCAHKFKKWDNDGFYKPYVVQLQKALSLKHDVQLHLHPHWLTTKYSDGKILPSDDFKLSDFKKHPHPLNISGIVEKGVGALNEICFEKISDYKCIAYRAGGYNLSPESGEIFSALYKNRIRIDSSVSKGYYYRSALNEVDYYNVPVNPNWFIGIDGNYSKPASSGVFEIPIASKPKSLFEIPTSLKLRKYKSRAPKVRGQQIHERRIPTGLLYKFKQAFSSRMLNFDNYTYSPKYLMNILKYNVRKYKNHETIFLSVISHPKSMSDYSFYLMKTFIKQARKEYPDLVEFTTFTRIYNELKL